MKIVRVGSRPWWLEVIGKCPDCDTVFQLEPGDVKEFNPPHVDTSCPICGLDVALSPPVVGRSLVKLLAEAG
jgi:hypothetical protein